MISSSDSTKAHPHYMLYYQLLTGRDIQDQKVTSTAYLNDN